MKQLSKIQTLTLCGLMSLALPGCGRMPCASPNSPTNSDEWNAFMQQKTLLRVDADAIFTIKRDVHYFDISLSAEEFAAAFQKVMIDPKRRFGLIRVDRARVNWGQPFGWHERFQGRFQIFKGQSDAGLGCRVENEATSDYGEIELLDLKPNAEHHYTMRYAYLSGSPMAGSSTFEVERLTDQTCRVTQTFVYQENTLVAANAFALGVLKLHDQVVYSQVAQSAAAANGKILATDLIGSYKSL